MDLASQVQILFALHFALMSLEKGSIKILPLLNMNKIVGQPTKEKEKH